jgi:hypothetical protein
MAKSLRLSSACGPKNKPRNGSKPTNSSASSPAARLSLPEWGGLRVQPQSERVVQPKNAYPRFSFSFHFRKPNRKREKMYAAAYTTELAEAQARSLADLFGWTFIKVRKRERIKWHAYYKPGAANASPWMERAIAAWDKHKG